MGRLRSIKNAHQIISESKFFCSQLEDALLNTKNFKEINIEIGCGKGAFIVNNALTNKDNFYIGIDKYSTILVKAIKKATDTETPVANLKFLNCDAIELYKIGNNVFNNIYLNFSDPWPKTRHEKYRLTSPKYLDLYKTILNKCGTVIQKTDNDSLYLYSLNQLTVRNDVKIIYHTNDMYNDKNIINKNNIQTEYEKKFVNSGKNINKIVWKYI